MPVSIAHKNTFPTMSTQSASLSVFTRTKSMRQEGRDSRRPFPQLHADSKSETFLYPCSRNSIFWVLQICIEPLINERDFGLSRR